MEYSELDSKCRESSVGPAEIAVIYGMLSLSYAQAGQPGLDDEENKGVRTTPRDLDTSPVPLLLMHEGISAILRLVPDPWPEESPLNPMFLLVARSKWEIFDTIVRESGMSVPARVSGGSNYGH